MEDLGSLLEYGVLGTGCTMVRHVAERTFPTVLCRLDGVEVEEDIAAYGIR